MDIKTASFIRSLPFRFTGFSSFINTPYLDLWCKNSDTLIRDEKRSGPKNYEHFSVRRETVVVFFKRKWIRQPDAKQLPANW